jgi:hypothetical protein
MAKDSLLPKMSPWVMPLVIPSIANTILTIPTKTKPDCNLLRT